MADEPVKNNVNMLATIKKLMGINQDETDFDVDVSIGINTALSILRQLGVGPEKTLMITDQDLSWDKLATPDELLGAIQQFVYIHTKLVVDPPATSFGMENLRKVLDELAWRIEIEQREAKNKWLKNQ